MVRVLVIGICCAAFFWFFPAVDIAFSGLFHDVGEGFIYREHWLAEGIYAAVEVFTTTVVLLLLVNILGKFLQDHTRIVASCKKLLPHRQALFLLLALALGPGLVVHQGMKEYFERPRPKHILEFGGSEVYALPFEKRDDSPGKSFVSGHAAVGFYIAAVALLMQKGPARRLVYGSGIVAGLVTGMGRIVQGKHFLSDVVFSGVFTLLVIHLLYWLMFEYLKPRTPQLR